MAADGVAIPRGEPPPSPCTGVCALDADGYCAGCFRTGDEIGRWLALSVEEQWRLIEQLEVRRKLRTRDKV
ncbi:MAG: DUF1289 domain-containing protein [Sinobacteraceae bacterium]|nr:DUF1289 domain-containing protein [Nevskiaceae bacterium]